jgi:hypothetical protein
MGKDTLTRKEIPFFSRANIQTNAEHSVFNGGFLMRVVRAWSTKWK